MRFVIAARPGHGDQVPSIEQAAMTVGAAIVGAHNPKRVVVDATQEAIDALRDSYGDHLLIEPLIEHGRSSG